MFEHFSEQAKKVMALADREAAALQHDRVGTGEILLGLLVWAESLDVISGIIGNSGKASVFERVPMCQTFGPKVGHAENAITADRVRAELSRITGTGAGIRGSAYSLTPGAEKLLLLAYEEALNLCENPGADANGAGEVVKPEHLLLAMLREDEGVACRILEKLGLRDFIQTRAAILSAMGINQGELLEIRFEKARRQGPRSGADATVYESAYSGADVTADVAAYISADITSDVAAKQIAMEQGCIVVPAHSSHARELLQVALEAAQNHGHDLVGSGHLLLAALSTHKGLLLRAMSNCGVERYQVDEELSNILGPGSGVQDRLSMSSSCLKLLHLASIEALEWHHRLTGVEHIMIVLLREHEGVAGKILEDFSVDKVALRNKIMADPDFGTFVN